MLLVAPRNAALETEVSGALAPLKRLCDARPMTAQELCNKAAAALQLGNAAQAEQLAQSAVALAPRDFAALHLLALARFQTGKLGPALEAMQAAVAVNGAVAPAWTNLAMMQLSAGRKAEALASFDRTLTLAPPQAEIQCNCGNLLIELGRTEDAVKRFDAALALKPGLLPALVGRANALQLLRRFAEGLADCDRALSLDPRNPAALNNRAICLLGLSRPAEALESVERSLSLRPDSASALANKASALMALKRHQEALAACDQALALDPRHPEALGNRGAALNNLGLIPEALAASDAALSANPNLQEAWTNRIMPLRLYERYDDALASADRALSLGPATPDLLRARGIVLFDMGRHDEALACMESALRLNPDDAECAFNKAQFLMKQGRFAEGLPFYEARKRIANPVGTRTFPQPLWSGREDIAGKTIFVHFEQGLGDVIMFSRFVVPLQAMGARVILSVPEKLAGLFRGFVPDVEILAGEQAPEQFDYHVPMASLMLALQMRADTIPAPVPYLKADPERVARWKTRIGSEGFKVGIAWKGAQAGDPRRSFPVRWFESMGALPGVRLISLQHGDGTDQLSALPQGMRVETLGEDFDAGPDAFVDAAAAMDCCDLIVSLDTSIPHLAGAMGRPVWIALRLAPEWRWLLSRRDSPWYPSATLFHQATPGDWNSVFSAMTEKLRGML